MICDASGSRKCGRISSSSSIPTITCECCGADGKSGNHHWRQKDAQRKGRSEPLRVGYARRSFEPFLLTLILSPRERKQRAIRSGKPRGLALCGETGV